METTTLDYHKKTYGEHSKPPYIFSYAPGRMNFIGEHVDYMGGCVVPAPLDRACNMIVSHEPSEKWLFSFSSPECNKGKVLILTLDEAMMIENDKFRNLCFGSAFQVFKWCHESVKKLKPMHFYVAFIGKVPIGAGVSSSTSIAVAICSALTQIVYPEKAALIRGEGKTDAERAEGEKLKKELLNAIWRVEIEHCNVNGGIMDMYTMLYGKENAVLKIDCATRTHEIVAMPDPVKAHYGVILVNSMRSHNLGADYNRIHQDMENAQIKITEYLRKNGANIEGVLKLKDMAEKTYEGLPATKFIEKLHKDGVLDEGESNRSSYAVGEMERTDAFVNLTKDPKLVANPIEMLTQMGKLLNETHIGMSKKLKVSTDELEKIFELLSKSKGVYGARIMGGGFGGCIIAIIDTKEFTEEVRKAVQSGFKAAFPDVGECEIFDSTIGRGAYVKHL